MVWHILLSFYDIVEEGINVRSESKSDIKRKFDEASQLLGKDLSKIHINNIRKEHKEAQKQGVWVCTNCGKPESQLTEGRLKECGKCRAVQRNVRYCSRRVISF